MVKFLFSGLLLWELVLSGASPILLSQRVYISEHFYAFLQCGLLISACKANLAMKWRASRIVLLKSENNLQCPCQWLVCQ